MPTMRSTAMPEAARQDARRGQRPGDVDREWAVLRSAVRDCPRRILADVSVAGDELHRLHPPASTDGRHVDGDAGGATTRHPGVGYTAVEAEHGALLLARHLPNPPRGRSRAWVPVDAEEASAVRWGLCLGFQIDRSRRHPLGGTVT
jgi:hypothetical protein